MTFPDASRQPFSTISILIGGIDAAKAGYVVFAETTFSSLAAAQPGTATIVLRDPDNKLDFVEGVNVKLIIDGTTVWGGWAYTITRGYWFDDYAVRKWTLSCVDYNAVFDRLYIYNHAHPEEFPDNGGTWPGGNIPIGTTDKQMLLAYLMDSDINLITPTISPNRINETAIIVSEQLPDLPDGTGGTLMQAGTSLRGGFEDVAANVNPGLQGSMIFYVDPDGFIVYDRQDSDGAPFNVGEGAGAEVKCRGLSFTRDISTIKNDVILFTNDLNPATQEKHFKYRHNSLVSSINQHGRFQYSEVVSGFLAAGLQVRSAKILLQEGEAAQRAEFTVFKPGLLPGQIVQIVSETFGVTQNFPIRAIDVSFLTPTLAQFHVVCSFDTSDPYGLLLALKRPAPRGFVPPRFQIITTHDEAPPPLPPYTFIREIPRSSGTVSNTSGGTSKLFQLSYGYIRYSMVVHAGGLRAISRPLQPSGSLDFYEHDPEKGQFTMSTSSSGEIYAEYQVANDLPQ